MKKNKIIIPAMAMILFSTAASISGTVAWFTASRVFNTEVGNFSVVEIDGSLNVTMAPGEGTIKKTEDGVDSIKVRDNVNPQYFVSSDLIQGSFTSDKKPDEPAVGELWYNGTTMEKCQTAKDGETPATWAAATLTAGKIYRDASKGTYFVAKTETTIAAIAGNVVSNFSRDAKPDEPSVNDLWYNGTTMEICTEEKADEEHPAVWDPATLTAGSIYHDQSAGGGDYVAIDSIHIQPVSKNPAVLTHGSLNHTSGNAYVIDNDSDPKNPSYHNKGESDVTKWLQKANVTIDGNTADVYNAVSWTMTFEYTFAGDSSPIAVYLDLAKSRFVNVETPAPNPDFRKDGDGKHETSKGFRIGFYGEGEEGHDVVWGNNDPLMNVPSAYTTSEHYYTGSIVKNGDKYYKAKTEIATAPAEFAPASWDEIHDYLPAAYSDKQAYAVGSKVVYGGKIYKSNTPINDPGNSTHPWNPAEWDNMSIPENYAKSENHEIGDKAYINGKIYRCTADHDDTESGFDSTKWEETYDVTLDSTNKGIDPFADNTAYVANKLVLRNNTVYKAKANISDDHAWKASEWDVYRDTDLKYVSSESATSFYNETNYVTSKSNYVKLNNLDANEKQAFGNMSAPERICVLTPTSPKITINCAAWFEGSDPNVVSGAVMECLKAEMSFYSRTVNL